MEPKGKDPKAPVAALSPSPLFKKKKNMYIYIHIICLSAPSLSCSTQDLLVVASRI